ncbi:MAG: T9SS type A sorting domain-containing protein [Bacteroidia bacterium]
MKKTVISAALIYNSAFLIFNSPKAEAQTTQISTFESVVLTSNHHTVYNDSTGGGGFTSRNAYFPTQWDTTYKYWSGGWAASAFYDSSTAGASNLYGCAAYKGYSSSNTFAVGTTAGNLIFKMTDSLIGKTVSGMYVCNSTYAYKSMKYGDSFEPAFTALNKDWFKLTIKKYYGGALTTDSSEIYLADFRYTDTTQNYILKTWMWADLSSLGNTDSLAFYLHSTQNGTYGMNTPAFFCIDNLTLSTAQTTSINQFTIYDLGFTIYPNPTVNETEIAYNTTTSVPVNVKLIDLLGNEILSQKAQSFAGLNKFKIDVSYLPAGVYYISLNAGDKLLTKKLIKQ